jgi:hypothetical protein
VSHFEHIIIWKIENLKIIKNNWDIHYIGGGGGGGGGGFFLLSKEPYSKKEIIHSRQKKLQRNVI